jgi:delta24(24(1))-sterol reductase
MASSATVTNESTSSLRQRKSENTVTSDDILSGNSTAVLKVNAIPTEHGQEMDKKLDQHES